MYIATTDSMSIIIISHFEPLYKATCTDYKGPLKKNIVYTHINIMVIV